MANLRNIRQIGTPAETDKIYVEDNVYNRIHQEEFPDRRVFVLMGHTECVNQSYGTFIEAVIPVWEIGFSQNIPIWNNHVWNGVYQEIKASYENYVIVGWALDLKGMPPRITGELESIHRQQFGGAHQVFYLLDTQEREEYFYQSKCNRLRQKEGFYIYFDPACKRSSQIIPFPTNRENKEEKGREDEVDVITTDRQPRARDYYGEQLKGRHYKGDGGDKKGRWISVYGIAMTIVLLLAIFGTGIQKGQIHVDFLEEAVETMSQSVQQLVLPQEMR